MNEIIVAIITSVFALAGVIITTLVGNKSTEKKLKQSTDLTLYRLDQLEKKQDKHNTLIERMYKVEKRLDVIDTILKYDDKFIDALNNNNDNR